MKVEVAYVRSRRFFIMIWLSVVILKLNLCAGLFLSNSKHPLTFSFFDGRTASKQSYSLQMATAGTFSDDTSTTKASGSMFPPAISLDNLSCTHNGGETWQLQNVQYVLARGSKVALIGRNGCGKSTLLNILAESCRESDSSSSAGGRLMETNYKFTGNVQKAKDVRVAMVEQEPPMPSDITVGDAILGIYQSPSENAKTGPSRPKSVFDIVRRYKQAAIFAESDAEEFTEASAAMDERNGWAVLTKAEEVATKLRVFHLQDQPLSQLSGGERKRVALCAALVEEPDVLLLDEPTNFLSLAGVQWLADLLISDPKLTLLMVTHDRAFLEDVSDRILELDRGQLYEHQGSYASFLEAKEARLANEDAAIQAAKSKYRVELEWMRRQPQARESKSKARIDAFYKLEKATKPRPLDPKLALEATSRRLGTKILSMRGVSLKFGDRVMLDDFSYDFCPGDRICLAGANGIGKTTFTKLITGEIAPSAGTVELGDTVVLGVYDQLGLKFDAAAEQQTVLEFVVDQVHSQQDPSGSGSSMAESPNEARKLLQNFEFPRNRWNERISVLSGGERRRLQLLSVLSRKPNVLILDEPSVDCDLDTLSALETFLQNDFTGVLLLVSHDRSFADKVTDHLFVMEGNGIVKDFQGSLSEYATCLVDLENEKIQQQRQGGKESSSSNKAANYKEEKAIRNERRNFIRQSKKDMSKLEKTMERLQTKADSLQEELDNTSSDEGWSVLADLTDQLQAIQEELDTTEQQWLELAEKLEAAEEEDKQ